LADLIVQQWVDSLEKIYEDPKYQAEIKNAVINSPADYRQKVESDELMEADMEMKDGEYRFKNGQKVPDDRVKFVKETIDKRMLTESPTLQAQNLRVKGGMIVPDRKYHMKQKAKKVN
jgi:predicted Zn-dependent protease|tara:strand:+ start:620 stop:973 length:354 start_codon:yes stop_codon:yes gene_type:complete